MSVLKKAVVLDPEKPVLNRPVPSAQLKQLPGICTLRTETGYLVVGGFPNLPGLEHHNPALNLNDLL
jgi:hypothetical protein